MQNSQENAQQNLPILTNNSQNKFYEILYSINKKGSVRNQLHCILRVINFIIVFIIFTTLQDINILTKFVEINSIIIPISIYSSIGLIFVQLLLGAIYGKQMELKIQFLVYRNILFTISFYLLVHTKMEGLNQTIRTIVYAIVICMLVLISWVTWLIGSQSFSNSLVIDSGVPYSLLFLFFEVFLSVYSTNSQQLKDLSLLLLTLTAIFSKFWVLDQNIRRSKCLQYTLIRISVHTNLLYAILLIIERVKVISEQQKHPSIFVFPLIIFISLSQFLFQYYEHMRPINQEFFNSTLNTPQFLQACQFILNDIDRVQNIKKEDIVKTTLIPIYYLHSKYCHQPQCGVSHEMQAQTLSNYKALSSTILRIVEQLYLKHLEVQYQNISLRIGLFSMFSRSSSNKVKALQLLTETQMMPLSWWDKMKIYFLKKSISDRDLGQFSQIQKMEDSFQSFNHSISLLMKYLSQFWTEFIDERIDFQKILILTDKITPLMKSIEDEAQKSIEAETFSTLHTMKMYSDYNRSILNDQIKSAMISDYVNLLSKKMSKVNQINYISADLQIGLIAISLNVKKLGQIKIANAQAASIFNYSKQQFMKTNVNSIMPQSFARYHDDFLKVFLVHENKKVNTDRRLLIGRKRENYIFQIFLQLQKSVITISDELIFIANIELAKMYQSNFLIICDDKGVISDRNSTFYELFEKSSRKKKTDSIKKYVNIQELIPNFFQIALSQKSSKETIQCFDNPIFGIIQIRFEIIKVQLPQVPDFGYIIKGKRVYDPKQPFLKNISLTSALLDSSQQRQLKGMKLQYSSNQHQYQFSQILEQFNCGEYFSEFTIPYVKLELFGSVLNQNLIVPKQYDSEIKTLRYYGDHFQRVEEPDSFSSQITEEQKFSANKNNILSMKTNLQAKEKTVAKKFPQILTIIIILIQIILVTIFYFCTAEESNQILNGIDVFSEAYNYRSKISQYIIYFQAQDDPKLGYFFKEKKEILKQELINEVTKAKLPQTQKQRAEKLIYLQNTLKTEKFADIVNDETLLLRTIAEKPSVKQTSTILNSLIGTFILLKVCIGFIITYWHKKKIFKILSMFLVLPEATIKKSHKNCMQFLRNASDTMQAAKLKDQQQQESENEQNQVKIKRFKNTAFEKSYVKFFKINTFTAVFLVLFVAMVVTEKIIWTSLEKDKQIHDFISTVMPEYSTNLMKIYSQIRQKMKLSISQQYTSKYQIFDYKVFSNSDNGLPSENEKFYKILYDSQCINSSFDLPKEVKCEQLYDAVMMDGVSEAVNLMAHELKKIERYYNETSIQNLNNITVLLFHLIKPKIQVMKEEVEKDLELEKSNENLGLLIFYLSLVIVSIVDAIYLLNYSLRQIEDSIESSRILINLISDSKKKEKEGESKNKKV